MATVDWPSNLKEPSSINRNTTSFRYKSDFEHGYVQVRKKFTKAKRRWELIWAEDDAHHVLDSDDALLLEEFFEDHSGDYILWTNPRDDTEYTVVFSDDELDIEEIHPGSNYYRCSLTLEEV